MATLTRTFELSEEAAQRLDDMTAAYNGNPGAYLSDLLQTSRMSFSADQLAEIDLAIKEDDARDHASDQEVAAAFQSFRS